MLSMAPVGSAGGAANYFAGDNYYTVEENTEESLWYGEGAELLGLAPGDGEAEIAEEGGEVAGIAGDDGNGEADEQAEGAAERNADAADPSSPEAEDPSLVEGAIGDAKAVSEVEKPDDELPPLEAIDASAEEEKADADDVPIVGVAEASIIPNGGDGPLATLESDAASPTVGEGVAMASNAVEAFDPDQLPPVPADPTATSVLPTDGTAAAALPIANPSGKVDAKTFENILNGILPDGTQMGKPGDRQLGMDLTFSMPKSASLLAYIGGDKRILEAHLGAVKTAMRWVEANLAETRVRDGQGQYPVRTGNLVYGLFQHDTSRALDPQGHIHAVIANMTRLPNGQWQALHNGAIWRHNTVTSSVYHAAFRDALRKIGYEVEQPGKHGTFEIAGVPQKIRDAFSQRREAILEKASDLGIATHKGMDKITTTTRDSKGNTKDRETLQAEWQDRAKALGWDPHDLVRDAKERTAHQPGLIERGLSAIDSAMRDAHSFLGDQFRSDKDPLVDRGLDRLRLTPEQARTQLAVASAIRIVSQREAAYEVNQVTKTALDLGMKGVTPQSIATRLTELIDADRVVPGVSTRRDNLVTMITTREAIDTERAIIANIDAGKGATAPVLDHDVAIERITDAAGDRTLNDGQMAAAVAILTSRDRINAVQGDAGTGKSTMLRPVADILKAEGKTVIGLAFQTKVASALREETGIEAMTVARFLIDHRGVIEGDKAATRQSRDAIGGAYLFLDEASMISNDQMLGLVTIANVTGAQLLQIGDRKQLLPIDSGKSFALSQAGGVATSQMTENLRQKTPELRAAAVLSKQGKTGDAIKLLGDIVRASPDRNTNAAAWWLALSSPERDTAAIFTSGKESRAAINARVQDGLRADGTLTGIELMLRVIEPVDRTREEMRYAKSYMPGMTLEVWKDVTSVGLTRGEYRVARVFGNGKVELDRNGKRTSFKPEKLPTDIKDDRLKLAVTKDIRIQKGERIRWTTNDRDRDLLNGTLSKVLSIDGGRVTVERTDQSVVVLEGSDPMLKRLDLAYALNMHMAQGITADKGALVMGSEERFLANQRLAHVGITRVREDLQIFTDDKEKLVRQIDRTSGNKTSALETIGELSVDTPSTAKQAAQDRAKRFDPGPIPEGLSLKSDLEPSKAAALEAALGPSVKQQDRAPLQLSTPEKTKELDL